MSHPGPHHRMQSLRDGRWGGPAIGVAVAALLQLYLAGALLAAWVLTIEIIEHDRARRTTRREAEARRRLKPPQDISLQDITAALATAVAPERTDALLLICSEALANALEHSARDGSDGRAELTVACPDHRHVRVDVTDHGGWRAHARGDSDRGRGRHHRPRGAGGPRTPGRRHADHRNPVHDLRSAPRPRAVRAPGRSAPPGGPRPRGSAPRGSPQPTRCSQRTGAPSPA